MLISSEVLKNSGVAFGTSGARGLVSQFNDEVCAAFTCAFIDSMLGRYSFQQVAIAIDNRPSSPQMAKACADALQELGIETIYYGVIPTPALAYSSMQKEIPSIMVTGSHIPFDRNGLKFYRPDGEITKEDELLIMSSNSEVKLSAARRDLDVNSSAGKAYIERYTKLFNKQLLNGKRIAIYEHSSAGRDLYKELFTHLGADVISLERSDEFVPIDTEAVSEADKIKAKAWAKKYDLDAIFSTDGDGDRPLVSDENGDWLRGDILGLLCSQFLNIEALAVPVSCNTSIEASGVFSCIERTKIGSPFVIEAFGHLIMDYNSVAGFEANGGYLLGTDIMVNGKSLSSLPTRDAVLPAIILLAMSNEKGISELVRQLPKRYTYSDRIQNFPPHRSRTIISNGIDDPNQLIKKLEINGQVEKVDLTDGLRITLEKNNVIHLRPSGNAPELRCYCETDSNELSESLVIHVLEKIIEIE